MERSALTPYTVYARVMKTQGLKGEVVVDTAADRPFSLPRGASLWVVPPLLEGPRHLHLRDVRGESVISFDEIDSIDDASLLVGKSLLVQRDAIGDEFPEEPSLIGFEVVCSRLGDLGRVTDEFETPANGVLVVEGSYGEVLIPLVESIVTHLPVTPDDQVEVTLPRGLIDAEAEVVGEEGENV